jgi:hypothetical protein
VKRKDAGFALLELVSWKVGRSFFRGEEFTNREKTLQKEAA